LIDTKKCKEYIMFKNGMRPIHPGEVLLEDYIKPMGISVRALSLALHVPYSRLREIVDGNRGVSADTALRLERYFGSEAQGWLNLQASQSPQAHRHTTQPLPA
jgi:addiction module HigA family antidote